MRFTQEQCQQWSQLAESFEGSGMTRRRYCELKQIRIHQLDYWRKKLRRLNRLPQPSPKNWIPLQVREDQWAPGQTSGISLRIGRLTIEVKRGFDQDLLAEVIRVVDPLC